MRPHILSFYLVDYLKLSIHKIINYMSIEVERTVEKFTSSHFALTKDPHGFLIEHT